MRRLALIATLLASPVAARADYIDDQYNRCIKALDDADRADHDYNLLSKIPGADVDAAWREFQAAERKWRIVCHHNSGE